MAKVKLEKVTVPGYAQYFLVKQDGKENRLGAVGKMKPKAGDETPWQAFGPEVTNNKLLGSFYEEDGGKDAAVKAVYDAWGIKESAEANGSVSLLEKQISKTFKTLKQAERFQNGLYDKYDSVQLVKSPRFSEEGVYIFAVDKPIAESVENADGEDWPPLTDGLSEDEDLEFLEEWFGKKLTPAQKQKRAQQRALAAARKKGDQTAISKTRAKRAKIASFMRENADGEDTPMTLREEMLALFEAVEEAPDPVLVRIRQSDELAELEDVLLDEDWAEDPEHREWLATADEAEILAWADDILPELYDLGGETDVSLVLSLDESGDLVTAFDGLPEEVELVFSEDHRDLMEAVKKVIRQGELKLIPLTRIKKKMSPAQRSALAKARRTANTGSAKRVRAKSLALGKRLGIYEDEDPEGSSLEEAALSVADKHQLKIARDTMKMSDFGAKMSGGMTKEEARAVIKKLTGKDPGPGAEDDSPVTGKGSKNEALEDDEAANLLEAALASSIGVLDAELESFGKFFISFKGRRLGMLVLEDNGGWSLRSNTGKKVGKSFATGIKGAKAAIEDLIAIAAAERMGVTEEAARELLEAAVNGVQLFKTSGGNADLEWGGMTGDGLMFWIRRQGEKEIVGSALLSSESNSWVAKIKTGPDSMKAIDKKFPATSSGLIAAVAAALKAEERGE